MKISIDANLRRGLKIIPEIPDYQFCRIEGYNGIGKTNAIKLLRLCVGQQPFSEDAPSWRMFRQQLLDARITLSSLQGANTIDLDLRPANWPTAPEPLGAELGNLQIDGKDASLSNLWELLEVHHIMAAESPLNVLVERLSQSQLQISSWLSDAGIPRRDKIDLALAEVQQAIQDVNPDRVSTEAHTARERSLELEKLERTLEESQHQLTLLEEAATVLDRLNSVRGRGTEMDKRIEAISAEIEERDRTRDTIDRQIADASKEQHKNDAAEREFNNATRYLERQERSLADARLHLQRVADQAQLKADDSASVANERSLLAAELEHLTDRLPQVNATPLMLSLIEDIHDRLLDAENDELGDQVIVQASDANQEWNVGRLREAMRRNRDRLADRKPTAEAEQLNAKMTITRRRLRAISEIEAAQAAVVEFGEAQEKAEQRLRKAVDQLPEGTAKTLEELMKSRKENDESATALRSQLARTEHARELLGGGQTEDALAAELVQLCRMAQVEAPRIVGRRDAQRHEVDELRIQLAHVSREAEVSSKSAEQHRRSLRGIIDNLAHEPRFEWLRSAIPEAADFPHADLETQVKGLKKLSSRMDKVRDSTRAALSLTQGLEAAFGSLQRSLQDVLRGRTLTTTTEQDWDKYARNWLAAEVRQWFDNDTVRRTLFSPTSSDVELDPANMTLSWTDEVGDRRERPLSAFSSGEQAFAYTQARIGTLQRDRTSVPNRLIALDEFGAFLDDTRMRALAESMAASDNEIGDQFLVMLPLGNVFADFGGERDARVKSLQERGYFAERITP